ncbi:MAG TPA: hypothetical protein VJ728_14745 [Candidatus Binataceae bacterium]|nr:hypothetical protein [Candidatus Binataceae bacterium]
MKIIGNATGLLVAISLMIGLFFVQRSYQNSWGEPAAVQSRTATVVNGAPQAVAGYKVVMK